LPVKVVAEGKPEVTPEELKTAAETEKPKE
jgi:hypothetical protein